MSVVATVARRWFLMHVIRAKGPLVCLAQANGLGRRMQKNPSGPTARPFVECRRTELPQSCKLPGLQPSRKTVASIPRPLAWARQIAGPSARRSASDLRKTTRLKPGAIRLGPFGTAWMNVHQCRTSPDGGRSQSHALASVATNRGGKSRHRSDAGSISKQRSMPRKSGPCQVLWSQAANSPCCCGP